MEGYLLNTCCISNDICVMSQARVLFIWVTNGLWINRESKRHAFSTFSFITSQAIYIDKKFLSYMSNRLVLKVYCRFNLYQYGVISSFKCLFNANVYSVLGKGHTLVRSFYIVAFTIWFFVVSLVFNIIQLNSVVSNQSKLCSKGQPVKCPLFKCNIKSFAWNGDICAVFIHIP